MEQVLNLFHQIKNPLCSGNENQGVTGSGTALIVSALPRNQRRAEMVKAIDEIYAGEKERYRSEGREMPAPLFTEQDLREIETHAARRHDPMFYRWRAQIVAGNHRTRPCA